MSIRIVDVEQQTVEWFHARMGLPTASEFATVMATGKGGSGSKTRTTYLRKLAGEIITGQPVEQYTNVHLERGKEMEAEARDWYISERRKISGSFCARAHRFLSSMDKRDVRQTVFSATTACWKSKLSCRIC